MTTDLSLMLSMRASLSRVVPGWPAARQGEDAIVLSTAGADITIWNDAYIAKFLLAGGASTTVDLQNWTDLLWEAGKSFNKVFAIAVSCEPTVSGNVMLEVSPGAANPLQWFFRSNAEGIRLAVNEIFMLSRPVTDAVGFTVDATHKTLKFANSGADELLATVIVLGGHP